MECHPQCSHFETSLGPHRIDKAEPTPPPTLIPELKSSQSQLGNFLGKLIFDNVSIVYSLEF